VNIATSPQCFVEMCDRALANPDDDTIERGLKMADNNQWETIVARLEGHIEDVLKKKAPAPKPAFRARQNRFEPVAA